MKRLIWLSGFLLFSANALAQMPSYALMECNLIVQTVASVAIWRDNGVPLSRSQHNVISVLMQSPEGSQATGTVIQNWSNTVAGIYASNVTAKEIQDKLKPSCPLN